MRPFCPKRLTVPAAKPGRLRPPHVGWCAIVVSGDCGYRKPDSRLFQLAVDRMGVLAESLLYVGNDMQRDIYGASEVGMTTVMFDSDQGVKEYMNCCADYTITDHRQLLDIVDLLQSPTR